MRREEIDKSLVGRRHRYALGLGTPEYISVVRNVAYGKLRQVGRHQLKERALVSRGKSRPAIAVQVEKRTSEVRTLRDIDDVLGSIPKRKRLEP